LQTYGNKPTYGWSSNRDLPPLLGPTEPEVPWAFLRNSIITFSKMTLLTSLHRAYMTVVPNAPAPAPRSDWPSGTNGGDFRIGGFHCDEDIGAAFPDGDRLRRNLILSRRIENGSVVPYSLSSAIAESPDAIEKEVVPMLDNPEKTTRLIAALKAAAPFEVELTSEVIKQLQAGNIADPTKSHRTVSDLSYAGDEGGIVCHIVPRDERQALFISLTHVRMPRKMPLAAAVVDYQKHRVKKLRKQGYA
jgi:hypothetical protein